MFCSKIALFLNFVIRRDWFQLCVLLYFFVSPNQNPAGGHYFWAHFMQNKQCNNLQGMLREFTSMPPWSLTTMVGQVSMQQSWYKVSQWMSSSSMQPVWCRRRHQCLLHRLLRSSTDTLEQPRTPQRPSCSRYHLTDIYSTMEHS